MAHTYTRFKLIGVTFYFILVPSNEIHLPWSPQHFQRSHHGLPYPKLDILIQSFLEINDHVSLADAIDGSNVSEEWGLSHLSLEGGNDMEWVEWMNGRIRESGEPFGFVSIKQVRKRDI